MSISRKANSKVTSALDKRANSDRGHNNKVLIASVERLSNYIGGKLIFLTKADEEIDNKIQQHIHVVVEFDHFGKTYYGVWTRSYICNHKDCNHSDSCNPCEYYDPYDRLLVKLYDATSHKEIVEITTQSLQEEIMGGILFTSREDLLDNSFKAGYNFSCKFDKFYHSELLEMAKANPLPAIQELIDIGKPETLRNIFIAMGRNDLSTSDGISIGVYVRINLPHNFPHEKRKKIFVRGMLVNLYDPSEFATIAFFVSEWIRRNKK